MSIQYLRKVLEKVAAALENGEADEHFSDPRGGFLSVLAGAEVFLKRYELPESARLGAESYICRCHALLQEVQDGDWSAPAKARATELANEIRRHEWS